MTKWRVSYKEYHREEKDWGHQDIDAPTALAAAEAWILETSGVEKLHEVEWDLQPPVWPDDEVALLLVQEVSFWLGGERIYTLRDVEPCRWTPCPTCQGRGEVEEGK